MENRTTRIHEEKKEKLLTPVVWCILVTETGERFAYFGFRAILTIYFVTLGYTESQAVAFFSYTTCLAYLSPLAGALVADGALGRYRTILYFGLVYVLGLWVLTSSALTSLSLEARRTLTFTGLFFTCIGTGGIKPCVSAFGADQVSLRRRKDSVPNGTENDGCSNEDSERAEQVQTFFAYFYFCINVGALASMFFVPILKKYCGYEVAFLLPTFFMMSAMGLFFSKRQEYIHQENRSSLLTTFKLSLWLLRSRFYNGHNWVRTSLPSVKPGALPEPEGVTALSQDLQPSSGTNDVEGRYSVHSSQSYRPVSTESTGMEPRVDAQTDQGLQDAAQALHVLPILAMFPIFWCLYDQQGSVWTLQSKRMSMPDFVQAEQLQIVNPLEIMMFIPLFDRVVYPFLLRRGWDLAPLRRMGWGMILTAVSFAVSGLVERTLQQQVDRGEEPLSVAWQLPQITLLSVAEIFISVTGLEFAYASSPDRLKAFVMALFLLTTAIGDFFSGILYSTVFAEMNRAHVMYTCSLLMMINWAIFRCVAKRWQASSAIVSGPPSPELEMQDRQGSGLA